MEIEKIEALEQKIRYHNQLYTDGNPIISDAEYDALVDELKRFSPTSPVLMEIGAVPSYGTKIIHKIMMGSLLKINTIADLVKWQQEHPEETVWSWKIDGCAGEVVYENGKLVSAASRGDGFQGMRLTDNVRAIRSIPLTLDNCSNLAVRGEFYIPRSFFKKHLQDTFANARNCVASSLMLKDPTITAERGIQFIAYKVMNSDIKNLKEEEDFINGLQGKNGTFDTKLNFVKQHKIIVPLNEAQINQLEEDRTTLEFDVDGIVLAVNDNSKREEYGYLNDKYPKGMIAFKFKPEQVKTKMVGIEWNCGRTGRLVPVALLEPVKLAGSTISRCTLHNWREICRLGIKSIGQEVTIQKGGDIIPQIVSAQQLDADAPSDFLKPLKCPCCGTPTEDDKVNIWCRNEDCGDKLVYRICHYLKTLDIKEVGEGIISDLCRLGLVKKFSDIYYVDQDELAKIDGYGQRSAEVFTTAILSVTEVELWRFLASMGMPSIGVGTAKVLAKRYGSISEMAKNMEWQDLLKIDGISDVSATEILSEFKKSYPLIQEMAKIIKVIDFIAKEGKLKGKTFCCTGELTIKRKDVQKMIEDRGGEYTSIKKSLCFLLVGEGAKQAKIDKAIKLGAKVIDEVEFNKMII